MVEGSGGVFLDFPVNSSTKRVKSGEIMFIRKIERVSKKM
jgi:hypothetical protein